MKKILPKISERNKLLALSLVVGLCSGAAAMLLKWLISLCRNLVVKVAAIPGFSWAYLAFPALGMLLSFLVIRYVVKDNISHGVTKVLFAVSRNDSKIKPHNMWSSVITSALTIGFGGSVGAEAPIVYTGAAFGSNLGSKFGLSARSIKILVGCGAAGAVAGIFKAPMAGVLFTLEILLFNISMSSMMPLLVSTVAATMVAYLTTGIGTPFTCSIDPFSLGRVPYYIILGVFCAACSLYFQRMTLWLEDKLQRKLNKPILRWVVCAAGLGLLVFLFPPLYGEGYDSISSLLNGGTLASEGASPLRFFLNSNIGLLIFFALVLVIKVLAMTLTNAGGGVGGTFGPTLFVGGIAGFVLVRCLNLSFGLELPEQNFVLVGMCGLMAGVMQAPMTAIFLIAEITGGYELFLPLIICSTISFGTTRLFERYSIYSKRIADSGDLLTHDADQAAMVLMNTAELVRDKYPRINTEANLGDLVHVISSSTAAVIAVVDEHDRYLGVIDVDNVRKYILKSDLYQSILVERLMEDAPAIIDYDEKMDTVMRKFEETGAWRLPVVDSRGKYKGFISRSRLLTAYREELKSLSNPD